jgi:Flp pilus assembly protein TadB
LAGAAACLVLLALPDGAEAARLRSTLGKRVARALNIEAARIALVQTDLDWIPVRAWIGGRLVAGLVAALVAFGLFHVWVLAGLALVASYQLTGWALELRRRRVQLDRHRALLDAVRYGAAVMSQAGNVVQMLRALAEHGPWQARRPFERITELVQQSRGGVSLGDAIDRVRRQMSDPMFDDIALALALHERRGSRLVPALEMLATDWDQTLALHREARALRAGVEASVLILTLLPFVFLISLQLLAPALLLPFRSPLGEVLFGAAVVWMALGYRILQRMSAPPDEERVSFAVDAGP